MRIGYDAKWYFEGPASGRVVVRRHLEALSALTGGHEIVAILDREHQGSSMEGSADRLERTWMWGANNLIANALLLNRVARERGLDALIVHNFTPLVRACPIVAFIHDVLFLEYPRFYTARERLYFAPMAHLARGARRICTPSHSERLRLVAAGVAVAENVDVVPLGVDEAFKPKSQQSTAEMEKLRRRLQLPERFLLFVGRLNDRKNLRALLEAIPLLSNSDIPLVVVGVREWKSEDLRPLCQTLKIDSRVRFLGAIDHDTLPLIYALATVFVFPSWAESFGLPPLEALASGVPSVVSRTTSIPEVCGDAAVYCSPDSPASIAAAVDGILNNPSTYVRLQQLGPERATQFTWSASAKTLLGSALRASSDSTY